MGMGESKKERKNRYTASVSVPSPDCIRERCCLLRRWESHGMLFIQDTTKRA